MAGRRRGMSGIPDVLVIGAGPTGLTMALEAHDHGATVRVVERRSEPFRPSRAMIMHPRTLESLRPLGVTQDLLDQGDISPQAELHVGGRTIPVRLAQVELPDTAYPHLTLIRQMDVEEVLAHALEARGIEVERGTELVDVVATDPDENPRALLRTAVAVEETECRFLVGCDGSASTVRRSTGIEWVGGPHHEVVVLADLELDGPLTPGCLHVCVGRQGLVFLFALGETARWRLLATRPATATPAEAEISPAELQGLLTDSGLPGVITDCRWSSTIAMQHRLAGAFRQGSVFLAGDAAHAHSPAAAQGMNTGIQDAVNLGWKLAFAAHQDAAGALLDSYEDERRPVARQVVGLTRLVFFAEASTSPLAALVRSVAVPLAAPAIPTLVGQRRLMAAVVRLLSQSWVRYRHSPLSIEDGEGAGGPRAGDRLPDRQVTVGAEVRRLHAMTARPGVHVLLNHDAASLDEVRLGPWVTVHRLDDVPGPGVVAVRPDGHIGYRSSRDDPARLCAWLDLVGAR